MIPCASPGRTSCKPHNSSRRQLSNLEFVMTTSGKLASVRQGAESINVDLKLSPRKIIYTLV